MAKGTRIGGQKARQMAKVLNRCLVIYGRVVHGEQADI